MTAAPLTVSPEAQDEPSLMSIARQAGYLLMFRDYSALASRFGYGAADGREPAAAIEADVRAIVASTEDDRLDSTMTLVVRTFIQDEARLLASFECHVPFHYGGMVLMEFLVSTYAGERAITLEEIRYVPPTYPEPSPVGGASSLSRQPEEQGSPTWNRVVRISRRVALGVGLIGAGAALRRSDSGMQGSEMPLAISAALAVTAITLLCVGGAVLLGVPARGCRWVVRLGVSACAGVLTQLAAIALFKAMPGFAPPMGDVTLALLLLVLPLAAVAVYCFLDLLPWFD